MMIVDDSAPTSPAGGADEPALPGEDGITLADIPQIVEAAQAREQRRSLPRQNSIPFIAELSPVELAIVKHCAVMALQKSALRDQFDLDEILELVENKKPTFWNKIFKAGKDQKNVKKKGAWSSYVKGAVISHLSSQPVSSVCHWNCWLSERVQTQTTVLLARP